MLLSGLILIQALKWSIMALVEAPGFYDWYVKEIHLLSNKVKGMNGSSESWSVGYIEFVSIIF